MGLKFSQNALKKAEYAAESLMIFEYFFFIRRIIILLPFIFHKNKISNQNREMLNKLPDLI